METGSSRINGWRCTNYSWRGSSRTGIPVYTEYLRLRAGHKRRNQRQAAKTLSHRCSLRIGSYFSVLRPVRPLGEGRVLSIASIGLIAAGAAWLTGALLGFLFGIPHTREDLQQSDRYKPSTSLEQISDWLTKIIVGVSLTQLSNIPIKLGELARYIASGMSPDRPNAFALGIV